MFWTICYLLVGGLVGYAYNHDHKEQSRGEALLVLLICAVFWFPMIIYFAAMAFIERFGE